MVVASNGDQYDNDWENLDDTDDELELQDQDLLSESHSEWNDWMGENLGAAEDAIGKSNFNDELWDKIERLVRMRFETERNFKLA